jgi:hypothetical protein
MKLFQPKFRVRIRSSKTNVKEQSDSILSAVEHTFLNCQNKNTKINNSDYYDEF